jgi:phosphohistidine phosphatase
MRHGEAVPYHANDKSRALTRFGVSQAEGSAKRLAKFLRQQNHMSNVEQVLVSPYLRTQQTFEALKAHVTFEHKLDTDLITPMGSVQDVHDFIDGYCLNEKSLEQHASDKNCEPISPKQLMLVSHMPLVSLLADKVCKGFNGKIFDTADILVIDYDSQTHSGQQMAFFQNIN